MSRRSCKWAPAAGPRRPHPTHARQPWCDSVPSPTPRSSSSSPRGTKHEARRRMGDFFEAANDVLGSGVRVLRPRVWLGRAIQCQDWQFRSVICRRIILVILIYKYFAKSTEEPTTLPGLKKKDGIAHQDACTSDSDVAERRITSDCEHAVHNLSACGTTMPARGTRALATACASKGNTISSSLCDLCDELNFLLFYAASSAASAVSARACSMMQST